MSVRDDYEAWTQSAGVMKFALDLIEGAGLSDELAKLRPIAHRVVAEWEACAKAAEVDEDKRVIDLTEAATRAARELGENPAALSAALAATARAVGVTLTTAD
ncbi:MAG: hypothetical protein QM698_10865 [Micropepsaceae bacterium]